MSTFDSMRFRQRMLQLQPAVQDPDTKEIFLVDQVHEIHHNAIDRALDTRARNGQSYMSFDDMYELGRGYIRKDTGEFMLADDACEWAQGVRWDDPDSRWSAESCRLRHIQDRMKTGTYIY